MKYYAVAKGRKKGIYTSWSECEKQVKDYSGAKFKSFENLEEAKAFMTQTSDPMIPTHPNADEIWFYIDGAYNKAEDIYGYGYVAISQNGEEVNYGQGDGPEREMHNVAGELAAAMRAVRDAYAKGYSKAVIFYDYAGIANWVNGQWHARKPWTKAYVQFMRKMQGSLVTEFVKVKSHSHNHYNDVADTLAKKGARIER